MKTTVGHLVLCLLIVCAATTTRATERVFVVEGVVRAPYADGMITIAHDAIPGFMPAMTMPFHADASEVRGFAPGDRVAFKFVVGDQQSRATEFRRLGRIDESNAAATTRAEPPARPSRRLREGDVVPPFALIDQDNRAFTHEDLQGRRTLLTFIFTRCPVPDFCPLMMQKFETLQKETANRTGDPAVQLVSVTIDPEHDRPSVLREYGESVGADFTRWRFVTGPASGIAEFARGFAVRIEPGEGTLNHTLATALVDAEGRIVQIWRGNFWKTEEVLAALE